MNVALYLRMSSDKQEASIPQQEKPLPGDPLAVRLRGETNPCLSPPVVATMTMPVAGANLPPASDRDPYYE